MKSCKVSERPLKLTAKPSSHLNSQLILSFSLPLYSSPCQLYPLLSSNARPLSIGFLARTMVEIQESQLSSLREIYRDPSGKTQIFFGDYTEHQGSPATPVAVKMISCHGMLEPYVYIEECINQRRIPSVNVCQIYGWNIKPERVMIVMERMDKDLAKEIADRRQRGYSYFRENELITMCVQVVNIFAQMQLMRVSHNDIKAENIFLSIDPRSQEVVYKVGDFGSASTNRGLEHSLTGTPLYLSPILKQEYKTFNSTQTKRDIKHDPIKSDVFSLGVTLLFAATLKQPDDLIEMGMLQQKLDQHIAEVNGMSMKDGQKMYPSITGYLNWMLQMDEARRCDFIQIQDSLQRYFPEIAKPTAFFATIISQPTLTTTQSSKSQDMQPKLQALNTSIAKRDDETTSLLLEVFFQLTKELQWSATCGHVSQYGGWAVFCAQCCQSFCQPDLDQTYLQNLNISIAERNYHAAASILHMYNQQGKTLQWSATCGHVSQYGGWAVFCAQCCQSFCQPDLDQTYLQNLNISIAETNYQAAASILHMYNQQGRTLQWSATCGHVSQYSNRAVVCAQCNQQGFCRSS